MRDPAVQCLFGLVRIESRRRHATVHLSKAAGVPELGCEIAVGFDQMRRKPDVVALRGLARQRKAQRVGAIVVDDAERVDDVALRFRHLGALLVTNQAVDVDSRERRLLHEMQAHHHHPGDPEEDYVKAGHQRIGRVVALDLRRLIGPAQRRERPQCGGEPGIEHIFIAGDETFAL